MNFSAGFKRIAILTTSAALALGSAPTLAQTANAVSVRTDDLNLTTAEGHDRLRLRLMHAVSETCPIGAKCRASALSSAYKMAAELAQAATKGAVPPKVLRVQIR
jgi:UrcA family protein